MEDIKTIELTRENRARISEALRVAILNLSEYLEGGKFYQGRDTETIARNEIAAHQTLKNYIDQI